MIKRSVHSGANLPLNCGKMNVNGAQKESPEKIKGPELELRSLLEFDAVESRTEEEVTSPLCVRELAIEKGLHVADPRQLLPTTPDDAPRGPASVRSFRVEQKKTYDSTTLRVETGQAQKQSRLEWIATVYVATIGKLLGRRRGEM